MANNNNNTMGQLVVMTRADLDAILQDAIAASRSLVPEQSFRAAKTMRKQKQQF